jgi:hypothetical protein
MLQMDIHSYQIFLFTAVIEIHFITHQEKQQPCYKSTSYVTDANAEPNQWPPIYPAMLLLHMHMQHKFLNK